MAILTHAAIKAAISIGEIKIEGFKDGSIGTESIDLHLGSEIKMLTFNSTYKIYDEFEDYYLDIVDPKKPSKYIEIEWDEDDSILLLPNELYLGHTIEYVNSDFYHFALHDKSSTARIGVGSHLNSGFGDCGFAGQITLEIEVTKPTLLYKGMAICQISFETMQGSKMLYSDRESSKYMNQTGATESKIQNNFIEK